MNQRGWGWVFLGVVLGGTGSYGSARATSEDTYADGTDGFAAPGVDTTDDEADVPPDETDVIGDPDVPPDDTDAPWDVPLDPDVPPDETGAPWDVPPDPDVPPDETGAPWDVPPHDTSPGTWSETWNDGEVGPVDPVPTCDPGLSAQACWDGVGWACGLQWCTSDAECGAGEACIQRFVRDDFPTCTSGQQGSTIVPCDDPDGADAAPPSDPRDPSDPPRGSSCFAAQVCGNPADSLCAPGLVVHSCAPDEPVQCGLVQCVSDGSCSFGEVCRARYARVVDMVCAGGWTNSVTVPCTLGEPDCDSAAVCVPDPSPSPSDIDPDASAEGMAETASGTSGTASAEPIAGHLGDDMSGMGDCGGGGGTGLACFAGAALVLVLRARGVGRRVRRRGEC